ncbi:MAG: class I SAM-dependent methyltransferase [Syntrophales bacterium]|jgi:ubiquinone/menaquinone biosynthesis C-methylase UbiE
MEEKKYYIDYLKKTDQFPQSVYHRAKHSVVRDILNGQSRGSLVLDAACGIGNVTSGYCDNFSIVGIDEQLSALQYCRDQHSGKYVQGDLYFLPFTNSCFDLILFLDSIEHLTNPTLSLRELARVLKTGGRIIICTINYGNLLWNILENTWHRFCGGNCKTFSKDVHPTRYNTRLLRSHCNQFFREVSFEKRILKMELFYIGEKIS